MNFLPLFFCTRLRPCASYFCIFLPRLPVTTYLYPAKAVFSSLCMVSVLCLEQYQNPDFLNSDTGYRSLIAAQDIKCGIQRCERPVHSSSWSICPSLHHYWRRREPGGTRHQVREHWALRRRACLFTFSHFLNPDQTIRVPKKFSACRSRSRGTRPSGRRASGTPSWTSRTGRTRITRGTATRTAARWPPTPCGSPTATGSRRTTPLPPPSEDDAPPSSWLLTINKQSIPSVGRRSKKEKKHVIVYIRGFHVHRTGCLSRRCQYTVVLWTCGCGLTSCVY